MIKRVLHFGNPTYLKIKEAVSKGQPLAFCLLVWSAIFFSIFFSVFDCQRVDFKDFDAFLFSQRYFGLCCGFFP